MSFKDKYNIKGSAILADVDYKNVCVVYETVVINDSE